MTKNLINIAMLMNDNSIHVIDQFTSQVVCLFDAGSESLGTLKHLILCPNFDIKVLPLIIGNLYNDCQVVDIQQSGFECEALGPEDFKILGQMEEGFLAETRKLYCVGVNKYGKLTLLIVDDDVAIVNKHS